MITRLSVLALALALALIAADFWTKPYADWSEKELQQMINDSPWADRMQVETGQRGVIAKSDDGKPPVQGNLTVPITVIWQTALPVKLALYGKQADSNPQAKQLLDREETQHVLRLVGFPGNVRQAASDIEKLTAATVIKIKGKPDMHPAEIQLSAPPAPPKGAPGGGPGGAPGGGKGFGGPGGFGGGNFDIYMAFPKTITLDDKEFEFQTKIGAMNIRKKFKLKDMVYNGKLEM